MKELPAQTGAGLPEAWRPLWEDYVILKRQAVSERTLQNYYEAMLSLARFLAPHTPSLEALTRYHLGAYLAELSSRTAPATAGMYYRALSAVFGFLSLPGPDDEPFLERNPLKGLPPPRQQGTVVPVLSLEDARRLLAACKGHDFDSRRDEAMVRVLFDTGVRRGELASMRVDPTWLNLQKGTAMVTGKTGPRLVAFGPKTGAALLRYKRLRQRRSGDETALWLGHRGPLRGNGIYQALDRRFTEAGISAKHRVHIFRHTFSHEFQLAGGSEGDLMQLNGWTTAAMAHRYGRSAAQERAREAHARFGPGERL